MKSTATWIEEQIQHIMHLFKYLEALHKARDNRKLGIKVKKSFEIGLKTVGIQR